MTRKIKVEPARLKPRRPDVFAPLPGKPVEERHMIASLNYAAYIVAKYGDKFLPIFEKVERMLAEHRAKQDAIKRAHEIASSEFCKAQECLHAER